MLGTRILIKLGFRCDKCGSKLETKKERKLEWGTNCGGLLLIDPFYLVTRARKCTNCGHVANLKVIGSEPA